MNMVNNRRNKMQTTAAALKTMTLKEIANLIKGDWVNMNYAAVPFVGPMATLNTIADRYYADTGSYIVSYFLSNAGTWKGETARLVKAELKSRVAAYEKAHK
jgi:hypothetical protein